MNIRFVLLLISFCLASMPPAYAYRASNPAADNGAPVASADTQGSARSLLKSMNKNGAYARDLYRNTFMQIMGLVFFDPNTPDIKACQKDVMNYHLPELTRTNLDFEIIDTDVGNIMAQVYTADEIKWLQQFYDSPFGARMLSKQLQFNERLTRDIANKYGKLKPEFQKMYGVVAERCGGIAPSAPINTPKIGSELLSVPGMGASPIPISPEPTLP